MIYLKANASAAGPRWMAGWMIWMLGWLLAAGCWLRGLRAGCWLAGWLGWLAGWLAGLAPGAMGTQGSSLACGLKPASQGGCSLVPKMS